MAEQPIPTAPSPAPKKELSRNEKIRDFLIGFVGWFIINGVLLLLVIGLDRDAYYNGLGSTWACGFPLNILVLVFLAFTRRQVALGMLTALAVNFLVSLVIGLFENAICFVPFFVR
jgi:Na+/proline symporter